MIQLNDDLFNFSLRSTQVWVYLMELPNQKMRTASDIRALARMEKTSQDAYIKSNVANGGMPEWMEKAILIPRYRFNSKSILVPEALKLLVNRPRVHAQLSAWFGDGCGRGQYLNSWKVAYRLRWRTLLTTFFLLPESPLEESEAKESATTLCLFMAYWLYCCCAMPPTPEAWYQCVVRAQAILQSPQCPLGVCELRPYISQQLTYAEEGAKALSLAT